MEQINVNLLVQEYEATINSLLVENLRMKTYIRQMEMARQEAEAEVAEVAEAPADVVSA